MKTYAYRAVDAFGDIQTGRLDALDSTDLEVRLEYFHLDLISAKVSSRSHDRLFFLLDGFRHLNWFCRNLHRLVSQGVSLPQALADLKDLTTSSTIREASANLLEGIFTGQPLPLAFLRSSNIFDAVFIAMIGLGERQGTIVEMLARLGEYSRALDVTMRLKRCLWFQPIALLGAGLSLVCSLFVATLLKSFSVLVGSVDWTWFAVIFFVVGLCLSGLYRSRRPVARQAIEWLGMRWQNQRDALAFQFLSAFTILYRVGVEPVEAIRVANKTVPNRYMNETIEIIRMRLLSGENLDEAIRESDLFPSVIARIIQGRQDQGTVGDLLAVSRDLIEQQLAEKLSRIKRQLLGLGILSMTCLAIIIAGFVHCGGWRMLFSAF